MSRLLPKAQSDWAYFLDVDGTLVDIAATPDAALFDDDLRVMLMYLYQATSGAVALISGRSIRDLDARIGEPYVPRSGQHGAERRGAFGTAISHSGSIAARPHIRAQLAKLVHAHPALLLEDKGHTIAVHFRQAQELGVLVERTMNDLVAEESDSLEVQLGKCVAEIKPANSDKGTAILGYLDEPPFRGRRPIFVGDDLNDECAFAVVNALSGISIKVGNGGTCAHYRVDSVQSVRQWLSGAVATQR